VNVLIPLVILLMGCAGASKYDYYTLGKIPGKGWMLLDENPKDDKPLSFCDPSPQSIASCVVIPMTEFERMHSDVEASLVRLHACEKRCK